MTDLPKIKQNIGSKKVGIAGAGGLGSNCAAALTRSGVGKIVIADYDTVSESNLNRQFYFSDQVGMNKVEALLINLKRINPDIEIETVYDRVTKENALNLFSDCDVIVEALDSAVEKGWFIEYITSELPNIPLVAASGIAGIGNLNLLEVNKYGNLYICGDQISEVDQDNHPYAPKVGIVALMEADTVLHLLSK